MRAEIAELALFFHKGIFVQASFLVVCYTISKNIFLTGYALDYSVDIYMSLRICIFIRSV